MRETIPPRYRPIDYLFGRPNRSASRRRSWTRADHSPVVPRYNSASMSEYGYLHPDAGCASRYVRPIVARVISDLRPGSVVLDMGCGNGAMLGSFSGKGLDLHGIDASVSGIAIARRSHPELDFTTADLTVDLPQHPLRGRCDLVISTEVVEHLLLPRPFARNCFEFLRPGGRLIISTPYHGYLKNLALATSGRLDAHFTALWDYGHVKFWSPKTLRLLLEETGLRVVDFHGAGRVPFLWKSMVLVAVKPTVPVGR